MAEIRTVVGIRKTISKKTNNPFYTYFMTEDFTAYEKDAAEECQGVKVVTEGSGLNFNVNIGDKVKCFYNKGYNDMAVLDDIQIVEKAPFGSTGKTGNK